MRNTKYNINSGAKGLTLFQIQKIKWNLTLLAYWTTTETAIYSILKWPDIFNCFQFQIITSYYQQ